MTSWTRSVVVFVAVAGLVGALTWSELSTTEDIIAFQRDFVAAGGNVVVASNEGRIPAGLCAALANRPGVLSAGGLSFGPVVETNVAPGTLFQSAQITSGILEVWDASGPGVEAMLGNGIAIGSAAAEELGLVDGMFLGFDSNPPTPVLVVDVERRSPQSARWLLQPVAPLGSVDTCWAELEAGAVSAGQTLLEHVFAVTGPELTVRPLLRLGEFARDPIAELAGRPQAGAWITGGATLTLLVWLGLWFRRSELSLYRVLGTTRTGIWYLTQAETALLVVVAGVAGYLWAVVAYGAATGADPTPNQYAIAARTVLSTVAIPLIVGPLSALMAGGRSSLLNQLKDR